MNQQEITRQKNLESSTFGPGIDSNHRISHAGPYKLLDPLSIISCTPSVSHPFTQSGYISKLKKQTHVIATLASIRTEQ